MFTICDPLYSTLLRSILSEERASIRSQWDLSTSLQPSSKIHHGVPGSMGRTSFMITYESTGCERWSLENTSSNEESFSTRFLVSETSHTSVYLLRGEVLNDQCTGKRSCHFLLNLRVKTMCLRVKERMTIINKIPPINNIFITTTVIIPSCPI